MERKMKDIIVSLTIIGILISVALYTLYPLTNNRPPIADAGPDQVVCVGDATYFNGTGSDPDGKVILYEWDFDNDGLFDWNSTENGAFYFINGGSQKVFARYFYNSVGDYTAKLRITDDNGSKKIDTCVIHVNPSRIKFSLTTKKDSYIIGESLNVTVSLKNLYSEAINVSEMSLSKSERPSLRVQVKTPEGYILTYIGGHVKTLPDGLSLGPNETITYSFPLYLFGNEENNYYQLKSIGDYEINAIYYSNPAWCWDTTVWEGKLYSDVLTFTITS